MTEPTEPDETSEPHSRLTKETAASPAPHRQGQRRIPKEPSQEELDALPVKERLELINRRRENIHQTLNSVGILFGVLFTAASLVATALSVNATQKELHNSQEGQVTDRYTKAVDQLGSARPDIRLGGIYALERLASDSPRDGRTVYDVLTAFVREHHAEPCNKIRDPTSVSKIAERPSVDVQAALTVIGRRKPLNDGFAPNLAGARMHNADLSHADLARVNLFCTDLTYAALSGADLSRGNLHGAHLEHANLTNALLSRAQMIGANVFNADLSGADLSNAELTDAILSSTQLNKTNLSYSHLRDANLSMVYLYGGNLTGANLIGANLTSANLIYAALAGADLTNAKLSNTDLSGADLTAANLTGANLVGANLSGARLSHVEGMTPNEIRKQARVDSDTRF